MSASQSQNAIQTGSPTIASAGSSANTTTTSNSTIKTNGGHIPMRSEYDERGHSDIDTHTLNYSTTLDPNAIAMSNVQDHDRQLNSNAVTDKALHDSNSFSATQTDLDISANGETTKANNPVVDLSQDTSNTAVGAAHERANAIEESEKPSLHILKRIQSSEVTTTTSDAYDSNIDGYDTADAGDDEIEEGEGTYIANTAVGISDVAATAEPHVNVINTGGTGVPHANISYTAVGVGASAAVDQQTDVTNHVDVTADVAAAATVDQHVDETNSVSVAGAMQPSDITNTAVGVDHLDADGAGATVGDHGTLDKTPIALTPDSTVSDADADAIQPSEIGSTGTGVADLDVVGAAANDNGAVGASDSTVVDVAITTVTSTPDVSAAAAAYDVTTAADIGADVVEGVDITIASTPASTVVPPAVAAADAGTVVDTCTLAVDTNTVLSTATADAVTGALAVDTSAIPSAVYDTATTADAAVDAGSIASSIGVTLPRATLDGATLSGATLPGARLPGATLPDATLCDANVRISSTTQAHNNTEATPVVEQAEPSDEESLAVWRKHSKHILIISNAGKPIYSRYGDENKLSSVFGMVQAIISRHNDTVRCVKAGDVRIVFLVRHPLYFVCATRTDEPVSYLLRTLEDVYGQILFHLTSSSLQQAFSRRPGFDLRSLLGNIKAEMRGLLKHSHYTPSQLLDSTPVLRLAPEIRTQIADVLVAAKRPGLLFGVLFAGSQLVTMVCPKRRVLGPRDLILLVNFVQNMNQLRTQETWTPLCLPHFDENGFVHAYCAFVAEDVCLLLLSWSEDLSEFHLSSQSKAIIACHLKEKGLLDKVEEALNAHAPLPSQCEAPSGIHLMYRSKNQQYFQTSVSPHAPFHQSPKQRKAMIRRYAHVHNKLFSSKLSKLGTQRNAIWDARASDAVLGVVTDQYMMLATFHPFSGSVEASAVCNRFRLWVRRETASLFIEKLPNWG